jgi:hypothetical protein
MLVFFNFHSLLKENEWSCWIHTTPSGEVTRIKGDIFHIKEIGTSIYKVVVWHVKDGNVDLLAPNHNDDPPHLTLKDVEGTNTLWEERHLKLSNG